MVATMVSQRLRQQMSTTLKDIAQLAGVSTATASRVINGSHRGSSQVRNAVVRAVSALGYIPNPHATQLARANGDRKRTRQKQRGRELDVTAVRAPKTVMTRNPDSWESDSRILSLANENAHLRRVIDKLTSELRQTKELADGNARAIRPTQPAGSLRR